MMATVFLMQSLGQLFAAVVSIIAISTVPNHFSHPRVAVDSMWRWIYGVGAIFPAIALLLRMTIPESPRFTFDVLKNPNQATTDMGLLLTGVFRRQVAPAQDAQAPGNGQENGTQDQRAGTGGVNAGAPVEHDFPPPRSRDDLVHYLFGCGNWRYLVGTAGTWFLMDFAFFGLGLNSPQIVSTVWNGEPSFTNGQSPSWYSDPTHFKEGELPYNDFRNNAVHSLIIVSIGAVTGSLLLIWVVNHISRRRLIFLGFFILASLLFIVGAIFSSNIYSRGSQITVAVFYGLCQFFFNLGKCAEQQCYCKNTG
jgi:PHS family inorganic phosphate transporter-like MFS transporter